MGKRRTNAEIEAVRELRYQTGRRADAIENDLTGGEDADLVGFSISGQSLAHIRAEYERELADVMVVTFRSKDEAKIRKVGAAIVAALREG